ncbi:hypothetical protein ACLBWZ_16105 [Brucellaceae bacterium C25G]
MKYNYDEYQRENEYLLYYNLYLKGYSKCSLRANTALNIYRATDYAKYIGLPLNNFVTITFFDETKFAYNVIFSKIRNSINRWLKKLGQKNSKYKNPLTWIFVFENKAGRVHVHWLINIHKELRDNFIKK